MNSDIRIGFSIHPRWFAQSSLDAFLAPLRGAGLAALEFELEDRELDWPAFQPLMKTAFEKGMELSFHAPYREPRSLVGFAGEQGRSLKKEYYPLLAIAEGWAQRTGKACHLVVHAAVSHPPSTPEELVADTRAYFEWIAATFPDLNLELENNHPPSGDEIKVGILREDILKMTTWLPPDRLGICWDMGHDYLSGQADAISPEWLARVNHVHVHDVDEAGDDHYPLVLGRVPYRPWLQTLKTAGMKGIVVLELKGMRMRDWPIERVHLALVDSIRNIAREVS